MTKRTVGESNIKHRNIDAGKAVAILDKIIKGIGAEAKAMPWLDAGEKQTGSAVADIDTIGDIPVNLSLQVQRAHEADAGEGWIFNSGVVRNRVLTESPSDDEIKALCELVLASVGVATTRQL